MFLLNRKFRQSLVEQLSVELLNFVVEEVSDRDLLKHDLDPWIGSTRQLTGLSKLRVGYKQHQQEAVPDQRRKNDPASN